MQKISKIKTATSYAAAWLSAAKDIHKADVVFDEVKILRESALSNPLLWKELAAPDDEVGTRSKIVEELLKKTKLSDISVQTIKLVNENGRLGLLPLILETFIHLYYEDKGVIEVKVETAVELSKTQNDKLKKVLENRLKAEVIIEYLVKPEVLGGLAIRYKSFLIDDTIASKLSRIERVLKNGQEA